MHIPPICPACNEGQHQLLPLATNHDGWGWNRKGRAVRLLDGKRLSLERGGGFRPHAPHDLYRLLDLPDAVCGLRKWIAIGTMLFLAPACTQAQHQASAAEHLKRGCH